MEERLWIAARDGDEEEASRILEENKGINVNWKEASSGLTALHKACYNGHDKIVAMLLARPDIGVNQKTILGSTPFLIACRFGRTTCIRLLLKDGRVTTLNEPTNDGSTPLWWAAHFGHLEVIKWWIASGREMDLGEHGNEKTDAIKVARKHNMTEVASLLEGFRDHPETTRHRVRKEIGWYDTEAADHFALVRFHFDFSSSLCFLISSFSDDLPL